jgi:hypothetical protein
VFTNKLPNTGYLALSYYLAGKLMDVPPRDWIQAYLDYDQEVWEKAEEAKKKVREAQVKETRPSLPLANYTGMYSSLIAGDASIIEKTGNLHIQLEAHSSMSGKLTHWHYDTFLCKWDDPVLGESMIPFITDGQGHVTEFRVKIREDWIDPVEHIFKKLPEPSLTD